jgi:hypothetical protein
MIAKDVVLQFPDMSKPFEIISDASLLGSGAVLLQEGRPIEFTSMKFIHPRRKITPQASKNCSG